MSVHAKLTFSAIERRFDAADQRERQLRDFYTPTPIEVSTTLLDAESSMLMEKVPMPALTNFGMGYGVTLQDTAGRKPLFRNGRPIKHRFADDIEKKAKIAADVVDEDDEEAITAVHRELPTAARLSSVSQDFGVARATSPELPSLRAQTPDSRVLEQQALAQMNETLLRRSGALKTQIQASLANATVLTEDQQPLFDKVDDEGAASSVPVEEQLTRDAMRGQLNQQLKEGAAGNTLPGTGGRRSTSPGAPPRGFSPARPASQLAMSSTLHSTAGSFDTLSPQRLGGTTSVSRDCSIDGEGLSPDAAPTALQQLLGPSRSTPTIGRPRDISLKFNPPPKPAPKPWPKPKYGRRASRGTAGGKAQRVSTAALRDDPASYVLEIDLAPAVVAAWASFELVVTDVTENSRPSAGWKGLVADRQAGSLLFPQPPGAGCRAGATSSGFWPLGMLPWLDQSDEADQRSTFERIRDRGFRLELWPDLEAQNGTKAISFSARTQTGGPGSGSSPLAAAARADKLLDTCVFFPRVKKPQPEPVRWEKTCPRPKIAPPPATVRCRVTKLANIEPVELKTKLPSAPPIRRRRKPKLDPEEKKFLDQQHINVSGNGAIGSSFLDSSSDPNLSSLSIAAEDVVPAPRERQRLSSVRSAVSTENLVSANVGRRPAAAPHRVVPRVAQEITKAAEMGLVGGALSVACRPITPDGKHRPGTSQRVGTPDGWGVIPGSQSPPPSPMTLNKQVSSPSAATDG